MMFMGLGGAGRRATLSPPKGPLNSSWARSDRAQLQLLVRQVFNYIARTPQAQPQQQRAVSAPYPHGTPHSQRPAAA